MNQTEIDFFDALAPEWDANEIRSTPERVNAILDMIPLCGGDKVLDLGTGTGILIPYLLERIGSEGRVVGVDLSNGMLERARHKYGHLNNVDLLKLDFEEEQIPGIYDVVMLYSVYPHLHYPKETLDWLFRMNIRNGGCAVIAFPSDEKFINGIHHERNSESEHLLPAPDLAGIIRKWGFEAEVLGDSEDAYVILIKSLTPEKENTLEYS